MRDFFSQQNNSRTDKSAPGRIYTVSEVTREIRTTLEEKFPTLWVEGEISNLKKHSSGHLYFSLKDPEAQISCVMWRGRNQQLLFQPFGNLTVYERQGRYQLDVYQIRPAGIGELQLAFEAMKRRLAEEGLFLPQHKQALPDFPQNIGIVTSPTGAAIRDIVSVISRRYPSVNLILTPVRVQGEGAAAEISQAIGDFNVYGNVDVIIVGRGGGSLEDLWAFNEEIVARAIFQSKIPIVSAIGHEIDFSISDFVADVRAPTPSAAAEIVVKNREELIQNIYTWTDRLLRNLENRIIRYREKIDAFQRSYGFRWPQDRIRENKLHIDDLTKNMETILFHRLENKHAEVERFLGKLQSLNPANVLNRGYSITTRVSDNFVLTRASDVVKDDKVRIRFSKGSIKGIVEEIERE